MTILIGPLFAILTVLLITFEEYAFLGTLYMVGRCIRLYPLSLSSTTATYLVLLGELYRKKGEENKIPWLKKN